MRFQYRFTGIAERVALEEADIDDLVAARDSVEPVAEVEQTGQQNTGRTSGLYMMLKMQKNEMAKATSS